MPGATASGAADGAGPGTSYASAAPEGSPPGGCFAAQARSAPGVGKFVAWQRKRKAKEAALAESQGAKCARAGAASTPGQTLVSGSTADSDLGTARQLLARSGNGSLPAASAPRGFAALPRSAPACSAATAGTGLYRDGAASGDAFGWDRGAAARRGPGTALASAAAGSSDAELEADELPALLGGASEDAQGASPGGSSSGRAAPASAEGAGAGFGAEPEGSMMGAEAASKHVQQDPGQCLVLVAEVSPMAGELTPWFCICLVKTQKLCCSGPADFVKHAVATKVVLTKRQLEYRQWSPRAPGKARGALYCQSPASLSGNDALSCM